MQLKFRADLTIYAYCYIVELGHLYKRVHHDIYDSSKWRSPKCFKLTKEYCYQMLSLNDTSNIQS